MDEKQPTIELQGADYVASAAKSALGVIPFVGPLLVELAGTLIPNQRIERIVKFVKILEGRLGKLEQQHIKA